MSRIRLRGLLVCADEAEAALVNEYLPRHVELTRKEPGCLRFEVTPSSDPFVWTVEEVFTDRAAFDAHQQRVRQSEWGRHTLGIAREYEVEEIH